MIYETFFYLRYLNAPETQKVLEAIAQGDSDSSTTKAAQTALNERAKKK